jgi:hypothetical protein
VTLSTGATECQAHTAGGTSTVHLRLTLPHMVRSRHRRGRANFDFRPGASVRRLGSAQTDGANTKVPKPTIADAQKLVQMISSDKAKLKAYCDIGKLQEQMESADQKNDTEALDALGAKADSLAEQIGPEYATSRLRC